MSRSGYSDYCGDILALGRWRAQVASAVRGKRGQAFLKELVAALEAMPEKRLIAHELRQDGEVCALGVVGAKRGVDMESLDPLDANQLAETFGIASQLVQEIEYQNDEDGVDLYSYNGETGIMTVTPETPEVRWQRVYTWVKGLVKAEV